MPFCNYLVLVILSFFFFKKYFFLYLVVLGLCCYGGYSLAAMHGLLTAVASLIGRARALEHMGLVVVAPRL